MLKINLKPYQQSSWLEQFPTRKLSPPFVYVQSGLVLYFAK
jgi:hypothetical protein